MIDATLVEQLRRLQNAANMLDYHEFLEALGWERDDYTQAKYREFRALGRLHVFDGNTLTLPVEFYERKIARLEKALEDALKS
jgi:hypothetical protein